MQGHRPVHPLHAGRFAIIPSMPRGPLPTRGLPLSAILALCQHAIKWHAAHALLNGIHECEVEINDLGASFMPEFEHRMDADTCGSARVPLAGIRREKSCAVIW
jgi:hypothetical protein